MLRVLGSRTFLHSLAPLPSFEVAIQRKGDRSNAFWTAFDHTESGLGSRERHVVGNHWLGEALQGKRTTFFKRRCPFDRHGDALG